MCICRKYFREFTYRRTDIGSKILFHSWSVQLFPFGANGLNSLMPCLSMYYCSSFEFGRKLPASAFTQQLAIHSKIHITSQCTSIVPHEYQRRHAKAYIHIYHTDIHIPQPAQAHTTVGNKTVDKRFQTRVLH